MEQSQLCGGSLSISLIAKTTLLHILSSHSDRRFPEIMLENCWNYTRLHPAIATVNNLWPYTVIEKAANHTNYSILFLRIISFSLSSFLMFVPPGKKMCLSVGMERQRNNKLNVCYWPTQHRLCWSYSDVSQWNTVMYLHLNVDFASFYYFICPFFPY